MEFRDLKRQYQVHKQEIDHAVQEVIDGAHYISGPQVTQLEKELAAYVGVGDCIMRQRHGCPAACADGVGNRSGGCGLCAGLHLFFQR